MKLYFLRHCESLFNVCPTNDERDCGLTDEGKQQAAKIAGKYDLILCSTLRRARETLEYSGLDAFKIIYTHLCREIRIDNCDFLEDEPIEFDTDVGICKRIIKLSELIASHPDSSDEKRCLIISHHDFILEITGEKLENGQMISLRTEN